MVILSLVWVTPVTACSEPNNHHPMLDIELETTMERGEKGEMVRFWLESRPA